MDKLSSVSIGGLPGNGIGVRSPLSLLICKYLATDLSETSKISATSAIVPSPRSYALTIFSRNSFDTGFAIFDILIPH
jgi:hypothetical protein